MNKPFIVCVLWADGLVTHTTIFAVSKKEAEFEFKVSLTDAARVELNYAILTVAETDEEKVNLPDVRPAD